MREVLEALAADELSVDEAEAALAGYVTGEAGRFDVARERRRGIPEGILAEGKTAPEVADLVDTAVATTHHALVTRTDRNHREAIQSRLVSAAPDASIEIDARSRTVVVHADGYEPPSLDANVGVVTAGTADAPAAGEAAVVAGEIGARVTRIDDVGVANLTRITDRLPELRSLDVLIVAAGREGALPTVVAGLVDVPVIGLPVSTGYGHGGAGAAALGGMLQSCSALSVVNIDAGFTAGVQAGLIARQLDVAASAD